MKAGGFREYEAGFGCDSRDIETAMLGASGRRRACTADVLYARVAELQATTGTYVSENKYEFCLNPRGQLKFCNRSISQGAVFSAHYLSRARTCHGVVLDDYTKNRSKRGLATTEAKSK